MNNSPSAIGMALLTGCQDRHYAFGLATALASKGVYLDIIGSNEIDSPELHTTPNVRFLNFRRGQSDNATFAQKLSNLVVYYAKLIRYVARPRPKILHILWNYKLEFADRTILMLYYKVLGKKVVLTAHNVNQARRDSKDSWFNRTTLKIQYLLCDHIFVHTQKMKDELCQDFGVAEKAVTVIRYPINNALPDTELTSAEAKRRLGLREDERTILFFGRIVPYKGIEYLLDAFRLLLADKQANYRLIVAGEPKKGSEEYLHEIQRSVTKDFDQGHVILKMQLFPTTTWSCTSKRRMFWFFPIRRYSRAVYSSWLIASACQWSRLMWDLFERTLSRAVRDFCASQAMRQNWPKPSRRTSRAISTRT